MLQLTKIFHFEMAHAIHGYSGACRNIHGHSYELQVSVSGRTAQDHYIHATGFLIDFKDLKQIVHDAVIKILDHKIVVSETFLSNNSGIASQENIIIWQVEPSAENILLFIRDRLEKSITGDIIITRLKLFETKDSFAEWIR